MSTNIIDMLRAVKHVEIRRLRKPRSGTGGSLMYTAQKGPRVLVVHVVVGLRLLKRGGTPGGLRASSNTPA